MPAPEFAPALEWILIGDAIRHDETLRRAWDIASGMGLGPQRRRFHLRQMVVLDPNGLPRTDAQPWTLDQVTWPWPNIDRPCRLCFPVPLRMLFRDRLIEQPTLSDLVVAACRRARSYLAADGTAAWDDLAREALETSRRVAADPWHGDRLDLHRYSGRQHAELELRGVSGTLDLPCGPGPLWPLLAAAGWLHLGKGTVMGLGQLVVEAM